MQSDFHKCDCLVDALACGRINLGGDVLKVLLTATRPDAQCRDKSALPEIGAGGGYPAGGLPVRSTAVVCSPEGAALTGNPVTFIGKGGAIGPFQFAVLYSENSGAPIGFWDAGKPITLGDGETFTCNSAGSDGWDAANPLLTIG